MKHWCLQAYIKIYQGEDLPQPKTMLMVCAELWKIKLFFVKCFILYFFSPGYSRGQQPSSCSRSQRPVLQEHGESEFALSSKICVQALFCYFPLEKCSKLHWIEPLTEDPPPFCAAVSFNPRHEREIRTKNIYTWCKVVFFLPVWKHVLSNVSVITIELCHTQVCGGDLPYMAPDALEEKHSFNFHEALHAFKSTKKMGGQEFCDRYQEQLQEELEEMWQSFSKHNEVKVVSKSIGLLNCVFTSIFIYHRTQKTKKCLHFVTSFSVFVLINCLSLF